MNCKFCNAELPEEVTLCPVCGKENLEETVADAPVEEVPAEELPAESADEEIIPAETADEEIIPAEESSEEEPAAEEAPKPKRSIWVTVLAIIGGIALAAVLIGAVFYGMKAGGPKAESYTVSDTKAEKERNTVVATVGSRELTNSELQVYYWQGINDFYSYMGYYMDMSSMGLDLQQPLDQQFYDAENGVTWQQYFLQMALDTWHRYAALGQLAEESGFVLDEESQAYLDAIPQQLEAMAVSYGYESAEAMLRQDMGAACDVEGYLRYISLNFYVGRYFDQVYKTLEPSMEEMEDYYGENMAELNAMGIVDDGSRLVDVRHILFTPEGGALDEETGMLVYTDAEWEACRQKAQDLMDQQLAGGVTEETFAQLATQYTQDPGSQSTGGLYTDVYVGQMVEPFNDWCFDESRQYGDTGLVQTNYGYHIMFFVNAEPAWASNLRTQLVNERSTELVTATVESRAMDVDMKKIVLGDTTAEEE